MRGKGYIPSEEKFGIFPRKGHNYIDDKGTNGVYKRLPRQDSCKSKNKVTDCIQSSGNLMIKNNHSYVLYESANNREKTHKNLCFPKNSNYFEENKRFLLDDSENKNSYEPVINRNKKTIYKNNIAMIICNKNDTGNGGTGYKINFNKKNKNKSCEAIKPRELFPYVESNSSQENEQKSKEKIFMSNLDILLSYENMRISNKILIELLSPVPEIREIESHNSNNNDIMRAYREFLFKSDMGLELRQNYQENLIFSTSNNGNNWLLKYAK